MPPKTLTNYQECFLVNTWAYYKEGDIHEELGMDRQQLLECISNLRKRFKRHGDERWKLLYRKKDILPKDQLWMIEHYHEGADNAAKHFGVPRETIRRKAVTMRIALKKNGDERWRKLYVENKDKQVKIKGLVNYGNTPRPDKFVEDCQNKDPRPSWLVINATV